MTALPAAVTLITETTWSVGLPSLPTATQVPASFFTRSRPECGAGALATALSSPRTPALRASSISPPAQNRFVMSSLLGGREVEGPRPHWDARGYTAVTPRHKVSSSD